MLRQVTLRTEGFIKILKEFEAYSEKVQSLNAYKAGYRNKKIIYYTEDELVVTEERLHYLGLIKKEEAYTYWKQVVVRKDEASLNNYVKPEISGLYSLLTVNKNLFKFYKKDEVRKILESYTTEYDYYLKQVHILPDSTGLKVFKDCKGFDINGAHNDALVEMFPKAKEYFTKLFEERKEKPDNKKIVNYFVGMLNTKDEKGEAKYFPKAYNWIVQRTTKKLMEGIDEVVDEGTVLYANTDGFIVQGTKKELKDSAKLGEFKKELDGDVYYYRDKNYWVIQYINTKNEVVLKGNVLNSVRDKIDLFKGKVVHYDKILNQFGQMEATNVTVEQLGVLEND